MSCDPTADCLLLTAENLLHLLYILDVDDLVEAVCQFVQFLLHAVDSSHFNPVADTVGDDAETYKPSDGSSRDGRIAEEAVATATHSQHAEQAEYPPTAETEFLVVEGVQHQVQSLIEHPESEDEWQSHSQRSRHDDDCHAEEHLQQSSEESQSAERIDSTERSPCTKGAATADELGVLSC